MTEKEQFVYDNMNEEQQEYIDNWLYEGMELSRVVRTEDPEKPAGIEDRFYDMLEEYDELKYAQKYGNDNFI